MKGKSSEEVNQDAHTLVDHLRELRFRLIRCLYIVIIFTGISYGFSEKVFDFVRHPIAKYLPEGGLIYTGPLDKFIAHIKLAFICGIIFSCPFIIYQIWKFVAPGLYKNERKYTVTFIFSGTFLFLLGVAFSYFVALPAAFEFLFHFGGTTDKAMISIDQYFSFFAQTCIAFGISFELPLIIVILGLMGIVDQKFLREKRRYAIMTLSILAAIITPPDLMSMLFMLIPMIILYELGVFFVGFFERKNQSQDI